MKAGKKELVLRDAIRLRSAEFWLRLGEPVPALLELQKLTARGRKHPWSTKVFRCAYRTVA